MAEVPTECSRPHPKYHLNQVWGLLDVTDCEQGREKPSKPEARAVAVRRGRGSPSSVSAVETGLRPPEVKRHPRPPGWYLTELRLEAWPAWFQVALFYKVLLPQGSPQTQEGAWAPYAEAFLFHHKVVRLFLSTNGALAGSSVNGNTALCPRSLPLAPFF